MEKIQNNLDQRPNLSRKSYQELVNEVLADPDVADFIVANHLTSAEIDRSISKFFEFIQERDKYKTGDSRYIAKGYQPILIKNQGYADVAYRETAALVEAQRLMAIRERIELINLPALLKDATLNQGQPSSVLFDNPGRLQVLKRINAFIGHFPSQSTKGLYLYGDFGVGKSFIMAALAHDLSEQRGASTTMLHYPSFVVEIKNAIKSGEVKSRIDSVKAAEILILDDIGAEQSSTWVRDDVLQVILQYRMQENLPTFFTSNLNFADLERHFAKGKSGDETWQAKRIMERIRYLAEEVHLQGENRRH